jgi:hypothetical protein
MLLAPAGAIAAARWLLLLVTAQRLLFLRPRTLPAVAHGLLLVLLLLQRLLYRWLAVC